MPFCSTQDNLSTPSTGIQVRVTFTIYKLQSCCHGEPVARTEHNVAIWTCVAQDYRKK